VADDGDADDHVSAARAGRGRRCRPAVDAVIAETEARGGSTEAVPGWFAGRCGGRRRGLY
jgi:hypothetical protein